MRITTGVKIGGTDSFRLACSKLLGIYGVNLQNPPPALCRACIPDKGKIFLQRDQAGAESLIVANESGEGLYKRLVDANVKQHVYVALHAFMDHFIPDKSQHHLYNRQEPTTLKTYPSWPSLVKSIKQDEIKYYIGKVTNHARSYKMKWPTFQLFVLNQTEGRVVLSKEQAKFFLELWDSLFPEVLTWQDKIEHILREERRLVNLLGYPREFYTKITEAVVRSAISWIPQSTVGCITHEAAIAFTDYIETNNLSQWDLLNNKHDSLLIQIPDDKQEIEHALKATRNQMNIELTSSAGIKYHMKSEAALGYNWDKFHPEKNPKGMKEVAE